MEWMEELLNSINSPETATQIAASVEAAKAKYKPLEDWRKANKKAPASLVEAVMQRETYKTAYNKVYGPNAYTA